MTTSDSVKLEGLSWTSIRVRCPTLISCVSKPTYENIKIGCPFGISIEYLPSRSVVVPLVVPLIMTFTPGIALLVSSVTTPDIFAVCAMTLNVKVNARKLNDVNKVLLDRASLGALASAILISDRWLGVIGILGLIGHEVRD